MTAHDLMQQHSKLLKRLDGWFRSIKNRYANQMQCGRGCTLCCHGLFDISLPDALRLLQGFSVLPEDRRLAATSRALDLHSKIIQACPELREPYFLSELSEDKINEILEFIGEVRCPLLDANDACLIYEHRPLECILEGIPIMDALDGLLGDWCELNFKEGVSMELAEDFRMDYYEIQAIEEEVTAYLSPYFQRNIQKETTLFIPSVLAAFDVFRNLNLRVFEP